jgi:hypothetical protein
MAIDWRPAAVHTPTAWSLSSLANLDLRFCVCGDPSSLELSRPAQGGSLPGFLGALPNLQTLAIAFRSLPSGSGATYGVWLQDVVGTSHHWPRLTTLRLTGMKLTRSLFMDLLARHKDTLRSLGLVFLWPDSDWDSTLAEIRAMFSLGDTGICQGMFLESADGGAVLAV